MKRRNLMFALIVCGFLSLPIGAQVGKKGEVKPTPVPTATAPKKPISPKKNPPARRVIHSSAPSGNTRSTGNDAAANERTFWESIRNSSDVEDFREYLRQYPQGQFVGLAHNRVRQLESKPASTSGATGVAAPTSTSRRAGAIVRNQMGVELVYVPAGSFTMGSPASEAQRSAEEGPQHQVTVQSFYMGKYEVTQAQWQQVMGNNPSNFKGDNLPVETVSWNEAQEFIRKLNATNDGYVYRLPTEAEWEYACRAGTATAFTYGDSLSAEQANFDGNYPYGGAAKGVYRQKTVAVGSFQPNGWGLYDMHGNVWEWCEDWYHESYNGAPKDGSGWLSGGEQKSRVLRGGSWSSNGDNLRSAYRNWNVPGSRPYDGFRVVAVSR